MNNLIKVKKDNLYISTDILAKQLDRQHRVVYNLVNSYKKQLEMLGVLHFENVPSIGNDKGGGTKKIFYLNEEQYIFLISNMRTKSTEFDTVMRKKIEISKQFVLMRNKLNFKEIIPGAEFKQIERTE